MLSEPSVLLNCHVRDGDKVGGEDTQASLSNLHAQTVIK